MHQYKGAERAFSSQGSLVQQTRNQCTPDHRPQMAVTRESAGALSMSETKAQMCLGFGRLSVPRDAAPPGADPPPPLRSKDVALRADCRASPKNNVMRRCGDLLSESLSIPSSQDTTVVVPQVVYGSRGEQGLLKLTPPPLSYTTCARQRSIQATIRRSFSTKV